MCTFALLYDINGLIEVLKEAKLGVEISPEIVIDCLLYADDIVLIADCKEKLQRRLDLVTEYARSGDLSSTRRKVKSSFSECDIPQEN